MFCFYLDEHNAHCIKVIQVHSVAVDVGVTKTATQMRMSCFNQGSSSFVVTCYN